MENLGRVFEPEIGTSFPTEGTYIESYPHSEQYFASDYYSPAGITPVAWRPARSCWIRAGFNLTQATS